jgi:hypothetical protein
MTDNMKKRHAERHAAELARLAAELTMSEMVNLAMTSGPARACAGDGFSFAKAEQGGQAMAYSGSRAKLVSALRAQGMSLKQIDVVLKDATK